MAEKSEQVSETGSFLHSFTLESFV